MSKERSRNRTKRRPSCTGERQSFSILFMSIVVHLVWPDWTIFERSWQKNYLAKVPQLSEQFSGDFEKEHFKDNHCLMLQLLGSCLCIVSHITWFNKTIICSESQGNVEVSQWDITVVCCFAIFIVGLIQLPTFQIEAFWNQQTG